MDRMHRAIQGQTESSKVSTCTVLDTCTTEYRVVPEWPDK
jgi:hypothetical protein